MTAARGTDGARRPRWLVWTFLFLPAVLLTLRVVGYVTARGLDPADPIAERVVRGALPYLIAANHLTVFGLLVLALRRSGETLADIGWSVGISSAAFGLLHWGNGPGAIVATAVLGALLAGVYLWRRNLVAGTVAHALYNLAVLLT